MKLTRHDRPCDALGNRLPGGWPALKGNAYTNRGPCRENDSDNRTSRSDWLCAGRGGFRLATISTGAGPSDVYVMSQDHWRPEQ